jgi:isopentenyl diphosphate isomerase/L-lactate dehydrogenase-like FMN-dependent dehydrogenase
VSSSIFGRGTPDGQLSTTCTTIERHLNPELSDLLVGDLMAAMVEQFCDHLRTNVSIRPKPLAIGILRHDSPSLSRSPPNVSILSFDERAKKVPLIQRCRDNPELVLQSQVRLTFGIVSSKELFQSIDGAFEAARKRVPRAIYNRMIGTGVDRRDQLIRENVRVFDDVYWVPRAAMPYEKRDLRATVLGTEISFPVVLSSPGASRVVHVGGEPAVAAAAHKAGTIDIAAMGHGHTIEEVRDASPGPLWQQVFWSLGREAVEEIIERAHAASYEALVVTVDLPSSPATHPSLGDASAGVHRLLHRDNVRQYALDAIRRPRWTVNFMTDVYRLRSVPDVEFRAVAHGGAPARLRTGLSSPSLQPSPSWADFGWLREQWKGPIVVKGISTPDDAHRAVDAGAAAIVVSNHGGVGLSNGSPSLRKLRSVVRAVDGSCEVYFDSGVRRGADVVMALCLGARAVLLGRAYLMGLAAAGEAGVYQVLEILRKEIDTTLALLGCESVASLDESWVEVPSSWP